MICWITRAASHQIFRRSFSFRSALRPRRMRSLLLEPVWTIATATLLKMAREVPNIVALKDAAGNPAETATLIATAPDGHAVYSRDDGMTLPLPA